MWPYLPVCRRQSAAIHFLVRFSADACTNSESTLKGWKMTIYSGGSPGVSQKLEISSAAVLDRDYAGPSVPMVSERLDTVRDGIFWKRLLDVVASTIALVLLSPVLIAASLAVKFSSRGSVLFRQERIGVNRRLDKRRRSNLYLGQDRRGKDRRVMVNYGKTFTMYKFRTMVADAEKGRPVWAQKNDARITRVGAILRRTRIDELPQFVNVLRGDMSIVGPRPERAYFIAKIDKDLPEFKSRLRTKPGITGLAQVELGYTNTVDGMNKKLGFDLEYIRNLTPIEDLRILYRTVSVVITGKGAY